MGKPTTLHGTIFLVTAAMYLSRKLWVHSETLAFTNGRKTELTNASIHQKNDNTKNDDISLNGDKEQTWHMLSM